MRLNSELQVGLAGQSAIATFTLLLIYTIANSTAQAVGQQDKTRFPKSLTNPSRILIKTYKPNINNKNLSEYIREQVALH